MSTASSIPFSESMETQWKLPYRGTVGMASLIIAESAIFIIFVVAYVYYVGKSLSGPMPAQVLEVPIFGTICGRYRGTEWPGCPARCTPAPVVDLNDELRERCPKASFA